MEHGYAEVQKCPICGDEALLTTCGLQCQNEDCKKNKEEDDEQE